MSTSAFTLRSIIISTFVSLISSNAPKSPNPAAFTRYFTLGFAISSSALRALIPSLVVRSAVITLYFTPRLSPSSTSLSLLLATSQSSSTLFAYPFANSAPIPLDAPVTIAIDIIFLLYLIATVSPRGKEYISTPLGARPNIFSTAIEYRPSCMECFSLSFSSARRRLESSSGLRRSVL